jgi:hypothetical protein
VITRLRRPAHSKPKPLPYRVVRQTGKTDSDVCRHRWDWTAELCAHRRARREHEGGVFYTALPVATS